MIGLAWFLNRADLPDDAKGFLSVLGGCGDEGKALAEVGASAADVARWSRLPGFADHHRQALAHFASWKGWRPPKSVDPALWHTMGRLDQRPDPFRVARTVEDLIGKAVI